MSDRTRGSGDVVSKQASRGSPIANVSNSYSAGHEVQGAVEGPTRHAYQRIFRSIRLSIWLEDFSRVLDLLDELRAAGISDLRAFLQDHPECLTNAIRRVRVRDISDFTLELFEADRKEDLLDSLAGIFVPATDHIFIEELVTLWEGRRQLESETVLRTLKGRCLDVSITIAFEGERCEHTLVTVHDVSALKAAERAWRAAQEAAQSEIEHRRQAEETQQLLFNELRHRVKNTFAMIQTMASKTFRDAGREQKDSFAARLQALASAYDLLTEENWSRAPVADVVDRALAPFREGYGERFRIAGVDAWLGAQRSVLLAMALHELATNALKYGALTNSQGHVSIAWQVIDAGQEHKQLRLAWNESGGPPIMHSAKRGFGTNLVKHAFRSEGGRAYCDFYPDGAQWVIEIAVE
jgi:two-component sensor histidine kinase